MSSHNGDTPKTTITSLPTELVTRIVRLSSVKPSWDYSVERSEHLRNLALVCQAFRGPAQEELFRHVVLPSVAASRRFVALLKSRAGARFASTPRSLRMAASGRSDQHKLAIPFITKRCSRLESMWFVMVDRLDVALVASGTGLKELFCYNCQFTTAIHGRRPDALSLTRLGIRDCVGSSNLDPRLFINLQSLDIYLGDSLDPDDLNIFANSLGEHLSSLCIGAEDNPSFTQVEPSLFKNLLVLDTRLNLRELPMFLSPLPSHLRHLRAQPEPRSPPTFSFYRRWSSTLIDEYLKRNTYPSLEGLEHIRCGSDDFGPELLKELQLEAKLKTQRPEARLSFDEDTDSSNYQDGSIDAEFNPAFWAFVDDAEAEEAKRVEAAS